MNGMEHIGFVTTAGLVFVDALSIGSLDMDISLPIAGWFEFAFESSDWGLDWKGFIDEFKAEVPLRDRDYDGKKKVWSIKEEYYPAVRELRQRYFIPPNRDLFE